MTKRILISIFIFSTLLAGYGQDIHFSQYFNSPLLINPALTGDFVGSNRFILNYKNQWGSLTGNSYKTLSFSYDRPVVFNSIYSGLQLFNDRAGNAEMGLTQIALSMASKVRVQANDFLKLGIQAAWMQYSYNFEALTWNSQFDGSSINPDLNSSENGDNESINFIDFSSGLLWTHTYKKENQFNLGFAAFHLARPRYYSAIYDEKLYVRWVLHGDYSLPVLTRELILEPSFLAMMQGPSHEVVVGLSAKYFYGLDYLLIENLSYLSVGMYYRNRDAIIIDTRFNYMSILDIDLSYDINISKLYTSTKARGGFEIALLYTIPDYKLRKIRHNHRVPLKKH